MKNDWKRCLCESKKEKNACITWSSSSYTKIILIVNNAKQQKVVEFKDFLKRYKRK